MALATAPLYLLQVCRTVRILVRLLRKSCLYGILINVVSTFQEVLSLIDLNRRKTSLPDLTLHSELLSHAIGEIPLHQLDSLLDGHPFANSDEYVYMIWHYNEIVNLEFSSRNVGSQDINE